MANSLRRSVTVTQGIALYVSAVVGAGVLLLPGLGATRAGPASLVAWVFDSVLGIPLALTFAALASHFPSAGGVATFVTEAFGAATGTVVGWFYFIAAVTAQSLTVLTGAYYCGVYLGLGRGAVFLLAASILVAATVANARGLRVSARLQLGFSAAVVLMLTIALVVSLPRFVGTNWTPFAPHGMSAVASVAVVIFFAFFGWEAITHLAEEFNDPVRDVPRSTVASVAVITVLYVGVAADAIGGPIGVLTAILALLIALGIANAFVAATSRLGYALAREGVFPLPLSRLTSRGIPLVAVLVVGGCTTVCIGVSYLAGWGAENLLVVPDSLVIMTYLAAMFAGVRLLDGRQRITAGVATVLCLVLVPFSGVVLVIPATLAVVALAYRRWYGRPPLRAPGSGPALDLAESTSDTTPTGIRSS
jgi:amino acid efflux transporter